MLARGAKILAQIDLPSGKPLRVLPLRELTKDEQYPLPAAGDSLCEGPIDP